jgi:hypothetical protein
MCGGKGSIAEHAIAKMLGEDPATLRRVSEGRSRASTCSRVFAACLDVLARNREALGLDPEETIDVRQPGLFAGPS